MANLSEIIISSTPLDNDKLHAVDGTLLSQSEYNDFINYIADLYNDDPNAEYFAKAVPASYEVVGILTDNNGVVSGFSDNTNYIELPSTFTPSNKNWEIILKLTTPATIGQQTVFTFMDSTKSANVVLDIGGNNGLYFRMFNIGYLTLVNSLSTSTSYKVKIAYDGSTYKGYIENSGNWSLVDTINDSTALPSVYSGFLGVRSYGTQRADAFQGSIDLNETSISLDNTTWWGYVPEINDPEQAWQYEYNKYGVCDKFVYDGTNNTVRLPKYGNKLYTTDNTASNVYYYIQVKE